MSAGQDTSHPRQQRNQIHRKPSPAAVFACNTSPTGKTQPASTTGIQTSAREQPAATHQLHCATVDEWDAHSARYERTLVPTPDALGAYLGEETSHGPSSPDDIASPRRAAHVSAAARRKPAPHPLVTLRGQAPGFVETLLKTGVIDPDFVAAHAARRRYRCPRRRGAQWRYLELVRGLSEAVCMGRAEELPVDALGMSLVRGVSDKEDLAAVECRASVWIGERVDVLLLEWPVWDEQGGLLRKGRRGGGSAVDGDTDAKNACDVSGDRAELLPSLEDELHGAVAASTETEDRDLMGILEDIAYEKWLDFFGVLTPRQLPSIIDGTSLEWRALQALETNAATAAALSRSPTAASADWPALLQRLRDRTALLPTVPVSSSTSTHVDAATPNTTTTTSTTTTNEKSTTTPPPSHLPPNTTDAELNQRSLDRVTYLGGLLLPMSLVASVLSMNADFEPGRGARFWVFWAAAAPLTLVTVLVIYADKLRRAEVWVEMQQHYADAEETSPPPQAATTYADEVVVVDLSDAMGSGGDQQQQVPELRISPPGVLSLDDDDDDDDDEVQGAPGGGDAAAVPDKMDVVVPQVGHAWRKKQLGWAGAAMYMLRLRKPLRVEDGLPPPARRGG